LNRAGIANGLEADLFISIHCNAGGGKGVETYCFQKESKGEQFAKGVQSRLAEVTGLYDRGVKTAGFVVIKETLMPAILVETAFIDREEDLKFLASKDGQNKLSTAIAKGVYDYAVEN
jgi:N-acetylmuramoyl-L-alanine amidase